jgi:hypothetical protein
LAALAGQAPPGTGPGWCPGRGQAEAGLAEKVACQHNYTEREKHFDKQVWLSCKGAIDATTGTLGLIPAPWAPRPTLWPGKVNGWR